MNFNMSQSWIPVSELLISCLSPLPSGGHGQSTEVVQGGGRVYWSSKETETAADEKKQRFSTGYVIMTQVRKLKDQSWCEHCVA